MITLVDGEKQLRFEELGFIVSPNFKVPSSGSFDKKLQWIPGKDAPWDYGVQPKGKVMDITCKSICKTQADFEQKINQFNAFVLDENKCPKTLKLYYDYEPDKFYYVQLEGPFDPDRSTILKELSIPFFAGDSNKYAMPNVYDKSVVYGEVKKGDYYPNTQSFKWIYPRHYSGIYNHSAFKTSVTIKIDGTVKDGKVTHVQSNKTLTFPDITNGTILLDSQNMTVEKNNVSIFEGSNYNFFELVSGENGFIFEGEMANATVKYDWVHRF